MTSGGEKEKQQLSELQKVPPDGTHQDVASVCHAVNRRVSLSKLADNITGICREKAQANNEDDRSIP